jgi:HTH-type transcriptional regulator/antitoxin HigA
MANNFIPKAATFVELQLQEAFHPGITLAEKLHELGMGPKEFAIRTGKPEKTIIAVLKGKSSITPQMAVLFEMATCISANYWLNAQRTYDNYLAQQNLQSSILLSVPWAKQFPYTKMVERGWLPAATSQMARTKNILLFFGVANHEAWQKIYLNNQLKIAFGISLTNHSKPSSIAAWLRQGEQMASIKEVPEFSKRKLKENIELFQALASKKRVVKQGTLEVLCAEAGVKLIVLAPLTSNEINACTRWVGNSPVIQLAIAPINEKQFWRVFFKQLAHLFLHGKKGIFLEYPNRKIAETDLQLEARAFADQWF